MDHFLYRGAKTGQISFPLGGIGTGCIGLAGNGRLIDWEIYNRPNKGSVNGFSHFAVKVEASGKVHDARILHGDLRAPYMGEFGTSRFSSFGWGPRREYLTGLPHFADVAFRGEYPLADLHFIDEVGIFPGQVSLRAFNPLIPLNVKDSGIPAAFFEFTLTNTTGEALTYTLAGVLSNPLPANNLNTVTAHPWGHALHLHSDSLAEESVRYGDLTLATDAASHGAEVSWQQYWFRGSWFDSLEVYWNELNTAGHFQNRQYAADKAGERNEGLLAAHLDLAPGERKTVRFVITWNFPNCENYWKPPKSAVVEEADYHGESKTASPKPTWKNYYATIWPDSQASAQYALSNWERLAAETQRYHDALFQSDLPVEALDAVAANVSILKSPTVLLLEDGTFYGWEGLHPTEGCCEGSCTHVWNYAQTLPFLFPRLERSMREADYRYNLREDGGMPFRLQLPLGAPQWAFRPCADGQFGGVLKTYRDWKVSGDDEWLRSLWPAVKKSLDFAWHPNNEDRWDPDKTGVLWGRQHHTLDMELFGPNSWLTSFYLGALKAGAEMAEHLGDQESAAEYRAIFVRGKAWADEHLFTGDYYTQRIDLKDKSIVAAFEGQHDSLHGTTALEAYWNDEHGEIKYQLGEGSSIDQVLGQWHASLYGLGDILDPAQVKQASAAIFKHNLVPVMGQVYNPCRIYTLNDEGGLVICAWPEGAQKPLIPVPYSQEAWPGTEYSAASLMIINGLVDEGMTVVKEARKRFDGERRNPWNEFECGSNYARSMSSYALLLAFSGFEYDLAHGMIGFNPVQMNEGRFRCFWSLDSGWGEVEITPAAVEVRLLGGHLDVQTLRLPFLTGQEVKVTTAAGPTTTQVQPDGTVQLAAVTRIEPGAALRLTR
jgi:non-lysosomal glucosylceramidase